MFGQPNLWGYGISGDLPIVLVRVSDTAHLALVRQLLNAQAYWRVKGLRADLVILNEHPIDYLDEMQNLVTGLMLEPQWGGWIGKPGGAWLLRADGMAEADRRAPRGGGPCRVAGRSRRSRGATGAPRAVVVRRARRAGRYAPQLGRASADACRFRRS